jgi:hypothetical protein
MGLFSKSCNHRPDVRNNWVKGSNEGHFLVIVIVNILVYLNWKSNHKHLYELENHYYFNREKEPTYNDVYHFNNYKTDSLYYYFLFTHL